LLINFAGKIANVDPTALLAMKAMLKGKTWTSDTDAANLDEIMAAIRCMEVRLFPKGCCSPLKRFRSLVFLRRRFKICRSGKAASCNAE
jgi:hypothetical protein